MAHKKGVGSSKTFVSVVLSTTQATTLLWVRMTLCMHLLTEL